MENCRHEGLSNDNGNSRPKPQVGRIECPLERLCNPVLFRPKGANCLRQLPSNVGQFARGDLTIQEAEYTFNSSLGIDPRHPRLKKDVLDLLNKGLLTPVARGGRSWLPSFVVETSNKGRQLGAELNGLL
jgi:hypothetical protein